MKIVIDARLYGLENTGIGRYIMNLVEGLGSVDHSNDYYLLLRDKYFTSLKVPKNISKVRADFKHYSASEQLRLPSIIDRIKPDLVHFPHTNVPLFFRGKYIVTVHDLLIQRQNDKGATTLPVYQYHTKRIAYKLVAKNAVRSAIKIIAPSKAIKREISEYYKIDGDKVVVTHEGVSNLFAKRDAKPNEILQKYNIQTPYFIYTGNAYPHKNLERVISSIVRLNQHSRVEFAIVTARNIFTERLESLVAKYNAKPFVRLLGFVPDADLGILYKNSTGFVYASLYEGFGLPGLEAISAGTIPLVSDIPVFKEVYDSHAIYFDGYRIEEITSVLERALNMSEVERKKFIEKGQEFIKKYSWSSMAKETLSVYTSVNEGSASL